MRRAGFALVAALWLLVALSAIGLEFGLRARARHLAAANTLEAGRATSAAAAGLADAQALLAGLAREPALPGHADADRWLDPWAQPQVLLLDTLTVGSSRARVALQDAGASLNLPRATEDELRRLLAALRVDAGAADRLAQAMMDWQDADEMHRARGAEREDYLRASRAVLPTNRPFDRLADLRYVMGMTPDIYRRIRPCLTVLGTGQVNLNAADRSVLLALPGMTEQAVAVLLRRRSGRRPVRSLEELTNELPTAARAELQVHVSELSARAAFATREVIAVADAWSDGSPVHVTATALFAKAGENAVLVWRTVR